jgi:3-oxoacyl-[acyl-carrier-protein] synthase III
MQTQFGIGVALTGSGSATPAIAVDNTQLSQVVETSDEWIASRTGIRKRRLIQSNESLRSLATQAAERAIASANLTPNDVDLIILTTSTADDLFGSASQIQGDLGATSAVAFDLTAACSGFVFGLVTGAQFIQAGTYQTVVVVACDVLSRWVDWGDRRTCVLFGDGAGAVVMQANQEDRLLGFEMRSDGTQNEFLTLAYEPADQSLLDDVTVSQGSYGKIQMNGQEVYRFAVKKVPDVLEKALHRAELSASDIDWLLLHQANQRIMDSVADRLAIPHEKVISNIAEYGNTSAASIPLALDEAIRSGKVKPGDVIATAGFGAGLTWGAAIFRWGR